MAVSAADEVSPVEFRLSMSRRIVPLIGAVLVAAALFVAFNLAADRSWWRGLWQIAVYAAIFALAQHVARPTGSGYQSQLPLRLTKEHLTVAGPGDITLALEWPNIARAEIRGRLPAFLLIEPVDPDRTQPPMKRWQWAGHGQSRPYEILVPLAYMTPGRSVLRRELARRLPTAAVERPTEA
ncbi:hypothetical protein [Micromonospora sp. NPDC003776]